MAGYVGIICFVAFVCSFIYLHQRYRRENYGKTGVFRKKEEEKEVPDFVYYLLSLWVKKLKMKVHHEDFSK